MTEAGGVLGPLMIDVAGSRLTAEDRELLQHPNVGGVILFSRNYVDREQLAALVDEIRALRSPRLLVAVDHEGGRVQRFREGFTVLPPMAEHGRLCDTQPGEALAAARVHGLTIASELVASGIDLAFAPVLDVDHGVSAVIGDRALSGDADTVVALASAFCDGLAEGGMMATGKHFPGHGAVVADSHEELPVDDRDADTIRAESLSVFAQMVRRGIPSLMTAHVRYPAFDTLPASFSPVWLQEVLRGELGFDGVIVSDDLGMGGAMVMGDAVARTHAAQEAGCDLLLLCNDRAAAARAVEAARPNDAAASRRLQRLYARAG